MYVTFTMSKESHKTPTLSSGDETFSWILIYIIMWDHFPNMSTESHRSHNLLLALLFHAVFEEAPLSMAPDSYLVARTSCST